MNDKKREKREKIEKIEFEYKRKTRSLHAIGRNEDQKVLQKMISDNLTLGDEYYPVIKKNLSGSACDSKHIRNVVQLGSEASKKINFTSIRWDTRKFLLTFKREYKREYSKVGIDEYVNKCLRSPPSYEFFYGAIRLEGLVTKERRKRQKLEIVATQAVKAAERNLDSTDVEKDSTPKEVEEIYKKIETSFKREPERTKFFKTIVDPRSFTQTVENIFHTSFLVKEGKVGVKKGPTGVPILSCDKNNRSGQKPKKQSILSFSMADYHHWTNQR